jgi:hypothetical protein
MKEQVLDSVIITGRDEMGGRRGEIAILARAKLSTLEICSCPWWWPWKKHHSRCRIRRIFMIEER